jgi:HD-like signal output (HDOD) protein
MPAKLCSLPPLNSIATRVISLSDDPDADLRRMASVIDGDPAFAAEVLFLANSPLFGFPSKLQVLHHAMAVLGLERIKSLAMTVAMRAFVGSGDPMVPQCWRHSVACAVIAETLSPMFGVRDDQAYSAALMHDIGRLGLLKSYPRQMHAVLGGNYADSHEVLREERAAAQVDHQAAGAWLIKNWALPEPFLEICRHHHDPLQENDTPLLKLVKVSCLMADFIGHAAVTCRSLANYEELLAAIPKGARNRKFPAEEQIRKRVEERLSSLEH